MAETFSAYVIREEGEGTKGSIEQLTETSLPNEEVLVEISHSGLNYKDGLAICGKGIARKLPMVGGIDLVGKVLDGGNSEYQASDAVLVNGWGLSESHWGGYSQKQRLNSDWLVRLPDEFTPIEAMAIGTAGYTAMLCVMELEEQRVTPEKGEIIVTGASGGVGSVAIALLGKLGYTVVASSGREENKDYLVSLGAADMILRSELAEQGKPFQRERWAGGVDTVGSHTLANILAQAKYSGVITCCGLAGGPNLPTSVLPFILRNVRLIGVDSVMAPMGRRQEAWNRLARDLDKGKLEEMTSVEPMSKLDELGPAIVQGEVRGRIVIDVKE